MALPSEYGVSQAIRSSGFCGRCTTASHSGSGKAGLGSFFLFIRVLFLILRKPGRTTLENHYESR